MAWTPDEWAAFRLLVEEAWPGEFTDSTSEAWRTLLDAYEPERIVGALTALLLKGERFRPSVAELLGEVRRDPSRPTFAEAYRLIFGRDGVLRARPSRHEFLEAPDPDAAVRDAVMDRARQVHPLVGQFVARQGIERLLVLPLECPDWGEKHRRDLEAAWDQHVEAFDGREVTALAAGGRKGMRRLDPLAALTASTPALAAPGEDR